MPDPLSTIWILVKPPFFSTIEILVEFASRLQGEWLIKTKPRSNDNKPIFDQLFHNIEGSVYHFTGADFVDHTLIKFTDHFWFGHFFPLSTKPEMDDNGYDD